MTLKQKTVTGLLWSFFGNFSNQIITFIIGIVLARLLSPSEYGLVGMVTFLIVLSNTFVDSGFSQALIRKNDCNQRDYSTVFYFNLIIAVVAFIILFSLAGYISEYFNQPQLRMIVKVLSLDLVLSSLGIIQKTILIKKIEFKLQAKISFTTSVLSGLIAVIMAFAGFGVWSLVIRTLTATAISTIMLWAFNSWRPSFIFSKSSFKELFNFGYKLLGSTLIDRIYWNIYYVIIGKYFSAQTLGYYTRAEMFKNLPSQNITFLISGVVYPAFVQIACNKEVLKEKFRIILRATMFITFLFLIFMIIAGEGLIMILIGEQWLKSVEYLQLLCVAAIFFPMIVLNNMIINIEGRSDWYFYTQVFTKTFSIPIIFCGIYWGVQVLIIGTIIQQMIEFLMTSYFLNKIIKYNFKQQLFDIFPSTSVIVLAGLLVFIFSVCFNFSLYPMFLLKMFLFPILVLFLSLIFKLKELEFFKNLVTEYITKRENRKRIL